MIEEAVQSGAVDAEVLTIENPQTEGVTVPRQAAAVVRVTERRVSWIWTVSRIGIGLVVAAQMRLASNLPTTLTVPTGSRSE